MKTILCDLDCVVADFWGPALFEHNRRKGTNVTIHDIDDWSFPIDEIWKEKDFFARLPLLDGAVEGLESLLSQGHDVYLVSAGHGAALSEKSLWVRRELPFMRDRCVFTDGKTPKGIVRGDVLIDDAPHNLIDFKKRNPDGQAIAAWYRYTKSAAAAWDLAVDFAEPRRAWGHIVDYLRPQPMTVDTCDACGADLTATNLCFDCGHINGSSMSFGTPGCAGAVCP